MVLWSVCNLPVDASNQCQETWHNLAPSDLRIFPSPLVFIMDAPRRLKQLHWNDGRTLPGLIKKSSSPTLNNCHSVCQDHIGFASIPTARCWNPSLPPLQVRQARSQKYEVHPAWNESLQNAYGLSILRKEHVKLKLQDNKIPKKSPVLSSLVMRPKENWEVLYNSRALPNTP